MPLQTPRLVMAGLGIMGDKPPNDLQPPLVDGIHLRWAFPRERGFPWHGFYLFRRQHRKGEPWCLDLWNQPKGPQPYSTVDTNLGTVSSDQPLNLTDDFDPFGHPEFDLANRTYLRLTLPKGEPAHVAEVTIGFREEARLQVRALLWGTPVIATELFGKPGEVKTVLLEFDAISAIEFDGGEAALINLCVVPVSQSARYGWEPVDGIKYPLALPLTHPDYPASGWNPEDLDAARWEAQQRILYGDPYPFTHPPDTKYADGAVDVTSGSAEVIGSGTDWTADMEGLVLRVKGDTTAYTVMTVAAKDRLVLSRPYGGPTIAGTAYELQADPFGLLHDNLALLVQGGPAAGAMADRKIPAPAYGPVDGTVPHMREQRPLDLVLLAAVSPAVAQMVGLYWADQKVDPDMEYDYLIVGDWDLGIGHVEEVLAELEKNGFLHLDGYIIFKRRMQMADPLPAPGEPTVYALPGTGFPSQSSAADAAGSAGLTWETGATPLGVLLPDKPVMYHIWRATLGIAKPGDLPKPEEYEPITKERPHLVVKPKPLPPGTTPQRASDWPAFPLTAIDAGLPEGWYSYAVSGIDLFGRHSANSDPGRWFQWAPAPDPRPWYYSDPEAHAEVHPFAVSLLDKVPPPPPTGVEAFALDPADPLVVRDAAYTAWYATLSSAEQQAVVGLRVRWQWTYGHMRQAPDTKEFRIYYQPGRWTVPDQHKLTTNWSERYYVVGYNEHVTITTDSAGRPLRVYEVFLPAAGDAVRTGLSLTPTLAEPVVYGQVGVTSADDKTHTDDSAKWSGTTWGDRYGNESGVTAPATVFRVRREKPAAPAVPADSERVYATPADYHGRSFYTYKWTPTAYLSVHIYRALDDAVFRADWAERPRTALSASDAAYFPSPTVDPRWDATKRQQVADELNHLNTLTDTAEAMDYYRSLSNDALRVLAGLPGTEKAFSQVTIQPLDSSYNSYTDTLDGRAQNRFFYRAAYVDGAHNRSALSLSGPPVWLYKVVPPRTPAVTKVTGGDREIALRWASNRESDLSHYEVYRAETEAAARDIRLMALMHTEPVAADPGARPAEVVCTDAVTGAATYFYRVVAVDTAGNKSAPSPAVSGQAYDDSRPAPPTWNPPVAGTAPDSLVLSWVSPDPSLSCLVQRRPAGAGDWTSISGWLSRGTYTLEDSGRSPGASYDYRLRVLDSRGRQNQTFETITA